MKVLAGMLLPVLLFGLVSCSAKFACQEMLDLEGEQCESITNVYNKKMVEKDIAPPEKKKDKKGEVEKKAPSSEEVQAVRSLMFEDEKPLRLPPRVIRIWIAPWEDSDGDLHQPSYIYSEISPKRGRWFLGEKESLTSQPLLRPLERKPEKEKEVSGSREPEGEKTEKKRESIRIPANPRSNIE